MHSSAGCGHVTDMWRRVDHKIALGLIRRICVRTVYVQTRVDAAPREDRPGTSYLYAHLTVH